MDHAMPRFQMQMQSVTPHDVQVLIGTAEKHWTNNLFPHAVRFRLKLQDKRSVPSSSNDSPNSIHCTHLDFAVRIEIKAPTT